MQSTLALSALVPMVADVAAVLDSIRNWLTGLLVAIATVMLVYGGVRYMLAGGSPHHVEQAKESIRSALIGFALAALAPAVVDIARHLVGF